jgi:hypothetical protein
LFQQGFEPKTPKLLCYTINAYNLFGKACEKFLCITEKAVELFPSIDGKLWILSHTLVEKTWNFPCIQEKLWKIPPIKQGIGKVSPLTRNEICIFFFLPHPCLLA